LNNSEHSFMLDIVRANTKSLLTWLIVVGIVVVFAVNFGPGSLSKGGCGGSAPPYAAKVNGEVIPAAEWERQYRQLYQIYRQQAGEAFTRELADQIGLPKEAMSQIVDHELVVQEAKKRGIVVTPQELTRAVHAMPSFQEGGRFSAEVYEETTRSLYGSPAKFESAVKEDLLYQKMMAAVRSGVNIPDAEVRQAWEDESDKAALAFVRIPLAAAEKEVPPPSEADAKALADRDPARIQKFYDDNRARFDQRKKVRVRHILARAESGADDGAARKKIEDAKARVKKGEDFAKVAQALSEDQNTKARGGELGFVAEGLFDEDFAKAALSLEPGQVSDPVRTPSGWHLVQAEEVVPAKLVTLEAARLDIARELLVKERARKLAGERARAALEAARKGRSLAEQFPPQDAKAARTPVRIGGIVVAADETGSFGRAAPAVPKIGDVAELRAAAFAAQKGDVLPRVFDTPQGPLVAVVQLRETPAPAAFDAQRSAIESRLRSRKESQVESAWRKSLRDGARIETNETLAAARGVSPEE
jgi:peptidyl-prolyl cis-trans isomerase D